MHWRKLGQLFNPLEHRLAHGCIEFAQSPQALVLDDVVRIYFSTREKEANGPCFLSHVAFVDFTKNFEEMVHVSDHAIISLGDLGCFDEHGIFPFHVTRYGQRILAYTCGWSRRVSVSIETAIGLAESRDQGRTFQRLGPGPVLSSSPNEPMLVGDGFVAAFGEQLHMWYIFGTQWIPTSKEGPARVYKIGHAVSRDGVNWVKEEGRQIIADELNPEECQALPTVLHYRGRYHMYFCYREATGFRTDKRRGYRLGYAYSDDLANWTRAPAGIACSEAGWDSDMMCYPHLFACNDNVYLLYNGNEFGRYGFGLAVLDDPTSNPGPKT